MAKTKLELEQENEQLRLAVEKLSVPVAVKKPESKRIVEKVFKVRFSGKVNPDDSDDIFLSVNGVSLVVKRNVLIPLPNRFVEVARNARAASYIFNDEGVVIDTQYIDRYPFSILGESSWKEFHDYIDNAKRKAIAARK